ncbi:hypothetical protein QBC40DRAFT_334716 [Triangularia verruculosa]|uniref:Uncharacterized protein n=1 Tax=Triangularia verruculosa TaxID=2587418 RepID=A0AAN7AQ29_9PEZI|nr:hypothetical protein QBC40DRAFT_334716 [Triangularia verruculosa]
MIGNRSGSHITPSSHQGDSGVKFETRSAKANTGLSLGICADSLVHCAGQCKRAEYARLISGSIALTHAVGKVGDLILSFSQLWKEIKDVPETILTSVAQLEHYGWCIDAVESEIQAAIGVGRQPTSLYARAIQHFRHVHNELDELTRDLMNDIASSRRHKRYIARAEAVLFKKTLLEKHEKRLRLALKMVDMTLHLLTITQINLQPDIIASKVVESIKINNYQPSKRPQKSAEDTERTGPLLSKPATSSTGQVWRRTWTLKGCLVLEYSVGRLPGVPRFKGYRVRFCISPWFLSKAWDFQVLRATRGWDAALRHYTIVQSDSGLFSRLVGEDAISPNQLRRLFVQGLATPFVMDAEGRTLLHYAMASRLDLVEPLLISGVDIGANTFDGFSPLDFLDMTQYSNLRPEEQLAFQKALISYGAYDLLDLHTERLFLALMASDTSVADFLVPEVLSNYYDWPWGNFYHSTWTTRFVSWWNISGKIKECQFEYHSDCQHVSQMADIQSEEPGFMGSVLHYIAWMCFESARQLEQSCRSIPHDLESELQRAYVTRKWDVVKYLLASAAAIGDVPDFHLGHSKRNVTPLFRGFAQCGTPYMKYQQECQRCWRRAANMTLRAWVEDLEGTGIDLEEYGRATIAVSEDIGDLQSKRRQEPPSFSREYAEFGYLCKNIEYGPNVENWAFVFEWNIPWEDFLEDFWDWIYTPPLDIPGAWVD